MKVPDVNLSAYDIECLERVKVKMDEDSSQHHSIHNLAVLAGMGSTRLKTAFKQYYGKGLYTYLQDLRMNKARQLLQHGDKPIKFIARAAGFRYVTNFTAAFKKRFGVTPGSFRK